MKTLLFLIPGLFAFSPAFAKTPICTYKWKPKDVILTWAAFKTSDKLVVSGTFKKMQLGGPRTVKSYEEGLKKTHFRINTASVDSGNPDRDDKIRKYFFGPLKQKQISGRFKKENNQWFAQIRMNKITQRIPLQVELAPDESKVSLKGTMDILEWKMSPGLRALNQECADLHKGTDGISKIWPQIDLEITVPLDKKCK